MQSAKINFLHQLNALNALSLPKNDFAITGSGPLAIRNIRFAKDVDIIVRQNLWEHLKQKITPYDDKHIKIGNVEIWGDFINLTEQIETVIDTCDIIENYPFVNLQYTLSWKMFLNREKDKNDIIAIQQLIKKR